MNTVSFSELEAINRCERLWDYSYRRGLVPLRQDGRLSRGTVMHSLLATRYTPFAAWRDRLAELKIQAMESAVLVEEIEQVECDFELYKQVMDRYLAQDPVRGHQILHVEQSFEVPLSVGASTLKIKPDLITQDVTGIWLWDHKTVQDFDKDMELRADFDPQLSFYAGGLRQLGIPVSGIVHNFIRMRVPSIPKINKDGSMSKAFIITDEQTVREFVVQSGAKIEPAALEAYIARLPQQAFFRQAETLRTDEELEAISREIAAKTLKRNGFIDDPDLAATRTLIRDCVRCPFFGPCIASLKGGDEDVLLAEKYRKKREEDEDGIQDWVLATDDQSSDGESLPL